MSDIFVMAILFCPTIDILFALLFQVVREGQDCVFKALVSGAPQPEITWLKDKQEMKPDGVRLFMNFNLDIGECELVIKHTVPEDVGVYSCRASNPAGKATCTANVVVVREYPPVCYSNISYV